MFLEDKFKIAIFGLCLLAGIISPSRGGAENKEYNNLTKEYKILICNIANRGILSDVSWEDLDNNGKPESIVKKYKLLNEYGLLDKKVFFYEKENSKKRWIIFAVKVSNSEDYTFYSSKGDGEIDKKIYGKYDVEIPPNLK